MNICTPQKQNPRTRGSARVLLDSHSTGGVVCRCLIDCANRRNILPPILRLPQLQTSPMRCESVRLNCGGPSRKRLPKHARNNRLTPPASTCITFSGDVGNAEYLPLKLMQGKGGSTTLSSNKSEMRKNDELQTTECL